MDKYCVRQAYKNLVTENSFVFNLRYQMPLKYRKKKYCNYDIFNLIIITPLQISNYPSALNPKFAALFFWLCVFSTEYPTHAKPPGDVQGLNPTGACCSQVFVRTDWSCTLISRQQIFSWYNRFNNLNIEFYWTKQHKSQGPSINLSQIIEFLSMALHHVLSEIPLNNQRNCCSS